MTPAKPGTLQFAGLPSAARAYVWAVVVAGALCLIDATSRLQFDQAGLFALVSAGYDPGAMAKFWDRITETKGKKGSWLSDLFGTTRPEEKRLREDNLRD